MLNSHNASLFSVIRNAINHEAPELISQFDSSYKKMTLFDTTLGKLFYYLKVLVNNPHLVTKKIRLKLNFFKNKT